MYDIKQSTTITIPFFVHDANGDAVTGLIDAGFTKRISKNGGAFAAMTVTITEMENGWYSIPLSTSHSNTLGLLTILFTHGSAKQVNLQWRVFANINDDFADLIWDEATIGHSLGGSFGRTVKDTETDAAAVLVDTTGINGDAMRGTNNASLAADMGLLADAASDGDPTTGDTLMQYMKQLINILAGSVGVVAYPAEQAPGNGINLAEVIRAIHADVTGLAGSAMRGTDSAATATALDAQVGAIDDGAAVGDPSATESVMQYVKQLVNILAGTTGIGVYPSEQAPANGINLAEVIRAIHTDVTGLAGSAMVGTNSAALASVCTEARLSELDAGTGGKMANQIDVVETRTTAGGAGPWTTGGGGADKLLLQDTTIASLTSQTQFILAAGSADADAYNNCTIVIEDSATAVQKCVGIISDYIVTTKEVFLLYDPSIFTIATGDKVYILAENSLKAALQNRQLNVNTSGEADADAKKWLGGAIATPTVTGVPEIDITHLMGVILTEGGAGRLAAAFIKLFDVITPTLVASDVMRGTNGVDTSAMRGTDSAALASVLGGLADAAVDGDPTSADTVMQYMKQLINILVGSAGIVTWPAAVDPGNGVNIAEAIRRIFDDTDVGGAGPWTSALPKKNTAFSNIEFLMVDSTDHVVPKTGLTVTGTRSIDGGAFAGVSGTIAEVANGIYQFDALAADMNGTIITFRFISAGADDRFLTIVTDGV